MTADSVVVGKVGRAVGLRGEVSVTSYTDPPSKLLEYRPWYLRSSDGKQQKVDVVATIARPKGYVARLKECGDRTSAERLRNLLICIDRNQLQELADDEFYFGDLIGLMVRNLDEEFLGRVVEVIPTGANAVLAVKSDHANYLIPFGRPVLVSVRLAREIVVDWDAAWAEPT